MTLSIQNLLTPRDDFIVKSHRHSVPVDVLAISVACKRIGELNIHRVWSSFTDSEIQKEIIDDDIARARQIRDYYSKKIIYWKLKGRALSSFRQDLEQFIQCNGTSYSENDTGMIYKLPYLYEHDQKIENLKNTVFTNYSDNQELQQYYAKTAFRLCPVEKIEKFSKYRGKLFQYWFYFSESGYPAVIELRYCEDTKSIIPLWNNHFDNSTSMNVEGNFEIRNNLDFDYYFISKWNLISN